MGGVGTPIIGRPRPLPGQRRADHLYTLNCEEPQIPTGYSHQLAPGYEQELAVERALLAPRLSAQCSAAGLLPHRRIATSSRNSGSMTSISRMRGA
jgi:hypothetical protein